MGNTIHWPGTTGRNEGGRPVNWRWKDGPAIAEKIRALKAL
jgi:hypothetical protein